MTEKPLSDEGTEIQLDADQVAALQEEQVAAVAASKNEKAPESYHIVNPAGAIHEIPAEQLKAVLARTRGQRVYRLATKTEVSRYRKNYSMIGGQVGRKTKPKK